MIFETFWPHFGRLWHPCSALPPVQGWHIWVQSSGVKFGSKLGLSGHKLDKSGTFLKVSFQYILAAHFVPFGAKLTPLEPNLTYVVQIGSDLPQIRQIREFLRSHFSTFWLTGFDPFSVNMTHFEAKPDHTASVKRCRGIWWNIYGRTFLFIRKDGENIKTWPRDMARAQPLFTALGLGDAG